MVNKIKPNISQSAESAKGNYYSAGIYLMKQEIFQSMDFFSLEYDIFPDLA
jgi:NDP-sugar pyrophosphorylase family protein